MTTTPEVQTHDDPRIGGVDIDTWRTIPAPKDTDPVDLEERLGGYCIVAGDCDEADVWIEVTAEHPKAVAEFIVEAVTEEHYRQTRPRPPRTRPAVAIEQATRILDTDQDDVAKLVKAGRLTEMYTRPTFGMPEAIYNVTELEAIAAVRKAEAAIERVRAIHVMTPWGDDGHMYCSHCAETVGGPGICPTIAALDAPDHHRPRHRYRRAA